MKKPWQVWTLYLLCLALVVPTMAWLTMKIVEQDRLRESDRIDTELARREAELQDLLNSALYRMDWKLSPIVAQEAARPYYLYQAFYRPTDTQGVPNNPLNANKYNLFPSSKPTEGSGGGKMQTSLPQPPVENIAAEQASPLLCQTSEYVKLHFQIEKGNVFTSPQRPETKFACDLAVQICDITPETLSSNGKILQEASAAFDYEKVLVRCPSETIENSELDSVQTTYRVVPKKPEFDKYGTQAKPVPQYRGGKRKVDNKALAQKAFNTQRGNVEYEQRQQSTGKYANEWARNQSGNFNSLLKPPTQNSLGAQVGLVREGVMRPVWLDGNLVLTRRVDIAGETVVQCCWLDWQRIKASLKEEVADLLPDVRFEPLLPGDEPDYGRVLATLPAQLVVDSPSMLSSLAMDGKISSFKSMSGLRLAMLLAWCGLGLGALATAGLLHGVMKLSERRASFVSAVTHELRTPLTTFKMYSEMLADQMVPPDKQQQYAQTLQTQADRLSHLVENVLQFARLERGTDSNRRETISVSSLFDRFESRLIARAEQAEMKIEMNINDVADREIETEVQTVEQVVFNFVDNACKYAATAKNRNIEVSATQSGSWLDIKVRDHGPGIDPKFRSRMFQPFCKSDLEAANSAPGVGLGLALCQRMARSLRGKILMNDSDDGAEFVLRIPV